MNLIAKTLLFLPLLGACENVRTAEPKAPACANPARLEGHRDPRAPGIFIAFKSGIEPVAAAARMAQKYRFITRIQYSSGTVFTTDLDQNLIPLVQCEADVEYLEFNAAITTETPPPN